MACITNKVLLEYSPIHLFNQYLWLFLCYKVKVRQLQDRLHGLPSPKYLLSGLFIEHAG